MKGVDDTALTVLCAHTWPGNVRELRNVLERLAIMVPGEAIGARDLEFLGGGTVSAQDATDTTLPLHAARERFERDYIVRALAAQRGNISRAAEALGVERSNLYRKMRAFGIMSPRKAEAAESPSPGAVAPPAPDPA